MRRTLPRFPSQWDHPDGDEQGERRKAGHVQQCRQGRRGDEPGRGAIDRNLSVIAPSIGNIT
jgi:hypothetical protein